MVSSIQARRVVISLAIAASGCKESMPDAQPVVTARVPEASATSLQADWRPPLGDVSRARGTSLSGLAEVFFALSDSPQPREFRRCTCHERVLTVTEARFIASNADHLVCPQLTTLDAATARELSACSYLECPAVTMLDPATARALSQVTETLKLPGLFGLDAKSASELAAQRGHLNLSGISTLEPGVAEVLSEHVGSLMLNGLETATPEELTHLARHVGPVYLASLPAETPGLAEAFAGFRYPLTVKSTPEVAPPSGRQREDQP